MTGYDRIMKTLKGETVSPVPIMLHNFMSAAEEKGYTQGEYRRDPEKICRTHVDFARKYGMDGVLIDIDTCMEAGAIGVYVDLPENEPARVTHGMEGGLDACLDAMDPDCLKKYDRIKIMLEGIHRISREVKGDLLIRGNADQGPFSLAMLAVGIGDFMMSLLDDSTVEKTKLLIDRAMEVHLAFHRMIMEAGADITSFGDSSCGPDLIGPDMYREFSLPWHRKMAATLKAESIQSICHICGNLDMILEDVADAGFPAIEVDYKTDIPRAAEILRGKSVIMFGPIDPSGTFYFGTPERMRKETGEVLELFKGEGLVIGAGCALPAGVPRKNIETFVETVRTYPAAGL